MTVPFDFSEINQVTDMLEFYLKKQRYLTVLRINVTCFKKTYESVDNWFETLEETILSAIPHSLSFPAGRKIRQKYQHCGQNDQ